MDISDRQKGCSGYLDALSAHSSEKSEVVQYPDAMRAGRLLEVGPGGGAALKEMIDFVVAEYPPSERPEVVVFDIVAEVLDRVREVVGDPELTVSYVSGDASASLPFQDGVFSAINVSSIVHECFSYGGGFDGIDQLAKECGRIMQTDGVLIYRDPEGIELDKPVEMTLETPLAIGFFSFFVPKFLDEQFTRIDTKPTSNYANLVTILADGEPVSFSDLASGRASLTEATVVSLSGPAGFIHELQRHFLVFIKEVCPESYEGNETCLPKLTSELHGMVSLSVSDSSKAAIRDFLDENDLFYLDSDSEIYMMPATLSLCIEDINELLSIHGEEVQLSPLITKSIAWARKDGEEFYFYGTAEDVIARFAHASLTPDDASILGHSVLCPITPAHTRVVRREKYRAFGSKHLTRSDRMVVEEKRHIHFAKMPLEKAFPVVLEMFHASQNPRLRELLGRFTALLKDYMQKDELPAQLSVLVSDKALQAIA